MQQRGNCNTAWSSSRAHPPALGVPVPSPDGSRRTAASPTSSPGVTASKLLLLPLLLLLLPLLLLLF